MLCVGLKELDKKILERLVVHLRIRIVEVEINVYDLLLIPSMRFFAIQKHFINKAHLITFRITLFLRCA